MRPPVARVGIDRARGCFADREMVGVAEVDAVPLAIGTLRDDEIGSHIANDATQVAAQCQSGFDPTVGIAEKPYIVYPDDGCRRPLLGLAANAQILAIVVIGRARFTRR